MVSLRAPAHASRSAPDFVFGTVSVPDGQRGPWAIETFTVSEAEAKWHNVRCDINRRRLDRIAPSTYRRLVHAQRGVIMSNTPMEVFTNRSGLRQATGRVLVNGLGLGMFVEGLLSKPDVTYVRVIEIDADVIALVGPQFAHDPRVEIVHADALIYRPAVGEQFDYVWHDIWDDVCADNLAQMTTLSRRYGHRTNHQACWSRDMIKAYAGL